jgi:hypothetical protein
VNTCDPRCDTVTAVPELMSECPPMPRQPPVSSVWITPPVLVIVIDPRRVNVAAAVGAPVGAFGVIPVFMTITVSTTAMTATVCGEWFLTWEMQNCARKSQWVSRRVT